MVVGSSVGVLFVISSASSVLYLVGSTASSILLLLLLLLSVIPINMPSVENSELLVSLFDVEWF